MKARVPRRGILFVSHDATRTGAPIALLHLLRWFKKNGDRPFSVLLGGGGELVGDFEELANTWSMDCSRWRPDALRRGLLTAAGLGAWGRRAEERDVRRFAARRSPALVYANSIASARVIDVLAPQASILTHVHELDFMFDALSSPSLALLLGKTSQFVACSCAVRENLIRGHEVAPERVETVHESIPVDQVAAQRPRGHVLQELHIPADALLVVGSGTTSWRKGSDLFIQLARVISRQRPGVYFAWIGGGSLLEFAQAEHDIRAAELGKKIRFTGGVATPADYLAAADVFVLTSREDPYPLVCLEAAVLQKPIVCFANAGGMPEFVEGDCGFVVPYLDVAAMADRVIYLLDSSERRLTMGAAARRKVAQRHDISKAAPRILEIIERTIAQSTLVKTSA